MTSSTDPVVAGPTGATPRWPRAGRGRLRSWVTGRREAPQLTAFVLAGGGSRGAAQVGMLEELSRRGIRADRVYGASVGAINAVGYAGDPTLEGIGRVAAVWRGLTGADVFPRDRVHGPWRYFQMRPSVHSDSGLRRVISEGLTFERLEDATVPVEVVATSLTDGRERWFTSGPALEAVLASAAIPALLPPVVLDGDVLIDGGVVDNVPLRRAITGGATRVYVLLCGPLQYRPLLPRRPVEAVLSALWVAVHARFARELQEVPPGVEVMVFGGAGGPMTDYRDFSNTEQLMVAGREEVATVLDGHRLPRTPSEEGPVEPVGAPVSSD